MAILIIEDSIGQNKNKKHSYEKRIISLLDPPGKHKRSG